MRTSDLTTWLKWALPGLQVHTSWFEIEVNSTI